MTVRRTSGRVWDTRSVNVPGFIARRFYVAGSLRNTPTGFSLEAHNPMGEGTLVGVGAVSVDGRPIDAALITARIADPREGDGSLTPAAIRASDVTPERPIAVRAGERVKLQIEGERLTPGDHKLSVELVERSIGRLRFSISDQLRDDSEGHS